MNDDQMMRDHELQLLLGLKFEQIKGTRIQKCYRLLSCRTN